MTAPSLDIDRILRETFVQRVERHAVLGSTNDRARECAGEADGALPLLVVADAQTAGRGRDMNRWWTGPGSLAFSLLLDEQTLPIPRRHSPLVALAAALAVVDTVCPLLPEHNVGLHWPNDVFVNDRKLAGVLVEVLAQSHTVLGIGVNTNSLLAEAPPELQPVATTLRELTGAMHDQTTLLVLILRNLTNTLSQLPDAPDQIGQRAHALCTQRDQILTIRSGAETTTGRSAGIASDGALLLETTAGVRAFHSGTLQ